MSNRSNRDRGQRWLAVIADGGAATLCVVDGHSPGATLAALGTVSYDQNELPNIRTLPALQEFIAQHGLARCPTRLFFSGAGTIVHQLHLPPMSTRRRAAAIRTRLRTYAAGRELVIAERCDTRPGESKGTHVLAAGVDATLARGLTNVLRTAGLRVKSTTALTAAFGSPSEQGRTVQVILGERTSAIQVFADGYLVLCRDVLLGRADFVAAYQRPILTESQPVTLSAAEADELLRTVGVPIGQDGLVGGTIRPSQLWPLISPTLQRLRTEIAQTLEQVGSEDDGTTALSVLSLPCVPGLAEQLAAELHLQGPLLADTQVQGQMLAALDGQGGPRTTLDLVPPEERFVERLRKPALVAGICALLIMLHNANAPRAAQAQMDRLTPAATALEFQLEAMQERLSTARAQQDEVAAALATDARLVRSLPANVPAIEISRAVFETVPTGVELWQLSLEADETPAQVHVLATYGGPTVAGVVAAQWARRLADLPAFASAEVTSINSSNAPDGRVTITLRAVIR